MPAPLCRESPRAENDRLVVRWNYTHTGGLPITAADVYFNLDTSPDMRTPFSSVAGTSVDNETASEREDSIPLPEAGLHYQFTVTAENSVGVTETSCPPIRLDIGQFMYMYMYIVYAILYMYVVLYIHDPESTFM